ncbi:hypothetical protein [Treponema ruminis]|uniref:Uncharacterized protein n=1 Tax=Treponema ruminis TaxID=744515 RepID=A0A7W8LN64_9SPIR|nr:hypothetical protein [Treponema ruminis]MBB5227058.1 hypothetical protein [Treponema ruminis]
MVIYSFLVADNERRTKSSLNGISVKERKDKNVEQAFKAWFIVWH